MAECDWAILCDTAFQDITRKACLIGIFDRINATELPAVLNHATFVAKVLGSPGESFTFRVEVARETGTPIVTVDGPQTVMADSGSHDIFVNFVSVPFPEFGTYSLNVYINDFLSRATTFVIAQVGSPLQS